MTFDATPKGAASNSYATREEAVAYFATRPNSGAWPSSQAQQETLLIMATSRLDVERYQGSKSDPNQRLKHPRIDMYDEDDNPLSADVVDRYVKEAEFELAIAMAQAGLTDWMADTGLEQFDSVTVGPIAIQRAADFNAGQLPNTVTRLLLGRRRGGGGPVLTRG